MNKKTRLLTMLALLLMAVAAPARGEEHFTSFGLQRPKTRVKAPDFTLKDLEGRTVALEDLKGRVVVVNFWATWCEPCRVEMPSLSRLSGKFRDKGLTVLAVASDRGFFAKKNVRKFVKEYAPDFQVIMDARGALRKTYEVAYLPTTYIIGRDGSITGKVTGERVWDNKKAEELFRDLLEAK